MNKVYKSINYEKVKEWYIKYEPHLSITQPSTDNEQIKSIQIELETTREVLTKKIEEISKQTNQIATLSDKVKDYEEIKNKLTHFEKKFKQYEEFAQTALELTPDEVPILASVLKNVIERKRQKEYENSLDEEERMRDEIIKAEKEAEGKLKDN